MKTVAECEEAASRLNLLSLLMGNRTEPALKGVEEGPVVPAPGGEAEARRVACGYG